MTKITRERFQKGATHVLRAQLTIGDDSWATPDNVSSVAAKVMRQGSSTATYDADLTVGTVVQAAFVTDDDQWLDDTNDSRTQKGYNFLWTMPATAFPEADWYTVMLSVTDTSDRVTRRIFEGPALGAL